MTSAHRLWTTLPPALMALTLVALHVSVATADDKPPAGAPPTIQYEAHITAGGAAPPASVLTNPYKGDKQAAETGAQMFTAMNCDGCHGGDGSGFAAPSLADQRWRYGGSDEELFQTIFYGRPKGMPAFGGLMSDKDVWTIVTYLKSLAPPADAPTQSWVDK